VSLEIKPSMIRDKTLNICMHSCILSEDSGRSEGGETCDKMMLQHASKNMLSGMIHSQTSYWAGAKFQRMPLDAHFPMTELGNPYSHQHTSHFNITKLVVTGKS
jgi:hypothetical protein